MLKEKVKTLPTQPGVYLFKNERGRIIYVGKALDLRQRVKSYFTSQHQTSPKTRVLVQKIADLEYLLTDSEVEALILESNLIKKHRPQYNLRLTDDRSYPYLQLTLPEEYPRLIITRNLKKDGSRYWGPYPDVKALQETVKVLQRVFTLRSCRQFKKRERPCLNAHLKRCSAPCQGLISSAEYRALLTELICFLEGKEEGLLRKLTVLMEEAVVRLDFEKAAELRDQLKALEKVREKQKIVSGSLTDFDLFNYAQGANLSCVQLFFIRKGKLLGGAHFFLAGGLAKEGAEISSAFLKQYYQQALFLPPQILLPEEIAEKAVLQNWLSEKRGSKVKLLVPQRGYKKELLELAAKNAAESLQQEEIIRRERQQRESKALKEIAQALQLPQEPQRIEGYDLSNLQGRSLVGSLVVFVQGQPQRKQYRRFKIKTVLGPDDFAGLAEMLRRRLQRALDGDTRFGEWPDLILLDGGRGQLTTGLAVLEELALDIPVIALTEEDKVFSKTGRLLALASDSQGLYLLKRIRDEAHRFALNYHRLLRGQQSLASVLEEIPGLGTVRRQALLQHFQFSLAQIRQATVQELQEVAGIGPRIATEIRNFCQIEEEN